MKRVHLHISGLVQGVSYRWSARGAAARLGLIGWVRNLPDGRVETVAQGEDEAVAEFIAWCKGGPPGAEVSGVTVTDEPPGEELSGFQIRR